MREAAKTKYNSGKKWRNSELTVSRVGEKTFDSEMSRIDQFEGQALSRPRMLNVATTYSASQLKTMALPPKGTYSAAIPVIHYKLQQSQTCKGQLNSQNTSQLSANKSQQYKPAAAQRTSSSRNPTLHSQGIFNSLKKAVSNQKSINAQHRKTCLLGSGNRLGGFTAATSRTEQKQSERQRIHSISSINLI